MFPYLIWEQSATYTLAAICSRTCRLFGKSSRNIRLRKLYEIPPRIWCRTTLMLSSRPPVAAVGSSTMRDLWTKPSSKVTALRTITSVWSEIGREALHQSQMWPQLVPRNVWETGIRHAWAELLLKVWERSHCVCWTLLNLKNVALSWQIPAGPVVAGVNMTNRCSSSAQTFRILTLPLMQTFTYVSLRRQDKTKPFAHLSVDAV